MPSLETRRNRTVAILTIVAAMFGLTSCHADITYRFDVHADQTVAVSMKTVLDDQFYELVQSQAEQNNTEPFYSQVPDGWKLSRTIDASGNHVFSLTRTMPLSELEDDPNILFHPPDVSLPRWSSQYLATTIGIFHDHYSLSLTVPAFLGQTPGDESNPYARAGGAMAAGMVGVHVQLKGPWKVVSSNGATTPDGATQWDINLTNPTRIEYNVETLDVTHVAIAIAGVIATIVAATLLLLRRRAIARRVSAE